MFITISRNQLEQKKHVLLTMIMTKLEIFLFPKVFVYKNVNFSDLRLSSKMVQVHNLEDRRFLNHNHNMK